MGGGKGGGTSTTNNISKTEIPPEVLARYNAVNARAETVAQQPYQKYSNDPNAFVAGLTPTQTAGIQNTNAMAGAAQPYYGAATGLTLAGAQGATPGQLNTAQYMNPYTQAVVDPTIRALQQQQAQQLSQQQTQAIRGGAFGGERAGLQRAQLMGQQGLATAQAIAPLYSQGYTQAQGIAAQQQGQDLAAQQANLARLTGAGAQIGNLGTGAQQAGLAGAQAQLAAGQAQQQTEQAGKQAMYNQFMQEQGYPFQVAQFLANIATGTGALSGNTTAGSGTTTTQGGGGFFSDERLKENIQKVGKTNDGQPIYRYNYKGDPRTQIGLLAQDVEKDHPEAVGLAGGYKTVDYKKATQDAVHKADGGDVTDAYSMGAPSQMLDKPAGLGALALPQMVTGAGIPVRSMTPASEIEALRAPKATGFSPGTLEAARAQKSTLDSVLAGGNEDKIGMGAGRGYLQSESDRLSQFLAPYNSQGGLVGPEGGAFARGGYAYGGVPDYAKGIYGVEITPMQQRGILQGTPMASPQVQQRQADSIGDANKVAGLVGGLNSAYKARPDFLRSAEDVKNRKTEELYRQKMREEYLQKHGIEPETDKTGGGGDDLPSEGDEFAYGGLAGGRHGYYGDGYVNAPGYMSGVLREQSEAAPPRKLAHSAEDFKPPKPPEQKGGGLGELAQLAGTGEKLYKGGQYAMGKLGLGAPETAMSATSTGASAIPEAIDLTSGAGLAAGVPEAAAVLPEALGAGEALAGLGAAGEGLGLMGALGGIGEGIAAALPFLAFLSDERMKHDIKKVGTLFDGQPVYRYAYNGDDRTQMGLLAQKVEKDHPDAVGLAGGMKTVNYEKATDKAAKRGHYQDGSLVVPEDAADGGGDNETTTVGRSAPLVRPMRPVPTPEDAAVPTPSPKERTPGVASASRPSMPDIGGLVPEGMKDTLSSENFWVPALAGIGSMLASPNKTLLGAVGSGLVGGTSAYTGLQKQQSEIAKNSLDVFNKVFEKREDGDGNISYMNLQTGQPATPQEAFSFLKKMPGFSNLGTPPSAGTKEAPQRDAAVALAGDVINKGVEPVAPRISATSPGAGVAKPTSIAAADTSTASPEAPSTPSVPSVPSAPSAPALTNPQEGEPSTIRIPEAAQAEILKADAWARSQADVKKHLDEAELQSRIADRAQAQMRKPLTPEIRANLAKQFEVANAQAKEAQSRAETAVTRLTAPILTDISRQLGVSPEAVAGAARMESGKAKAVLAPDIVAGQAAAAGEKSGAEATARARVEQRTRAYVDPETGTEYTIPVDENGKAIAPTPPRAEQGAAPPAPERAQTDPSTGKVIPGRPKPPPGGGSVIPNLPANASVTKLGDLATKQIAKDAEFFEDMLGKSESLTVGSQRYNSIANAFKLFESGPGAGTQSDYAAIAKSWGYPDLAKRILDGDPEAVQLLQKEVPGLVLEQLKAATPRFAQSEFTALLANGVPDAAKLPGANFQMVAQGLAIMNRANAFMESWPDAKADGWRSMSSYYQAWSKANPLPEFMESAKSQMGNFAGMPLPPANKLAAGATYVTPKELNGETQTAMNALGIKPGDIWRYNGPGKQVTIIPREEMFSTHMGH